MSYYESMQELIGKTPLVKLNHVGVPEGARLFAKLELYNPAGSVKDRIGKYMIADAERRGLLRPGGTIVEATAGKHRAWNRVRRAQQGLSHNIRRAD